MSKLVMDVSMSLDGFAAGPDIRPDEPMGAGGESLHAWMDGSEADREVFAIVNENIGAAIIGRRTFELGLGPWGGTPWPGLPSFVVTHQPRPDLRGDNGGVFSFDGLEATARRAKDAAGTGDVRVLGPELGQALLAARLLDEIWIHLVPMLMGRGTPLFGGTQADLVPVRAPVIGTVTHLFFRVGNSQP